MTTATPLLSINDLHISIDSFDDTTEILHGVNLQLFPGEALALVGESGSGKSVTAQAILRLLGPAATITRGEIMFDGIPLHKASEKQMQSIRGCRIGMIFQDPMTSLNPTMTVGRQISEVLKLHEGLSTQEAQEVSIELLHSVGIRDPRERYKSYPFQLSGGMRQRVLIAMAVACRPDLLIADEPTTALDVTIQVQILDLLRTLLAERSMSLLFITHDLSLVSRLCQRVAVMHEGRVVETADADALFANPQNDYTRSLLQACRREFSHAG